MPNVSILLDPVIKPRARTSQIVQQRLEIKGVQGTSARHILQDVTVPLALCCPQHSQAQTGWTLSFFSGGLEGKRISRTWDSRILEFLEPGNTLEYEKNGCLGVDVQSRETGEERQEHRLLSADVDVCFLWVNVFAGLSDVSPAWESGPACRERVN